MPEGYDVLATVAMCDRSGLTLGLALSVLSLPAVDSLVVVVLLEPALGLGGRSLRSVGGAVLEGLPLAFLSSVFSS